MSSASESASWPRVLAIVPARRGSKGVPGKNMRSVGGRPLVVWSILASLQAQLTTKIVVSTDWPEVAQLSEKLGVEVPWLRPQELSGDEASTVDVVLDAVQREEKLGNVYDVVLVLEPTSPLRQHNDIDKIVSLLVNRWNELDAVVTAQAAPFHPSVLRKDTGNYWVPFCEELTFQERRQAGSQAYLPIGHTFAIKPEVLARERTFYCLRSTFFKVEDFQAVEIDREVDVFIVESLISRFSENIVGGTSTTHGH